VPIPTRRVKTVGAAGRRTLAQQQLALDYALRLQGAIPGSAITAYTDGSAKPNPGPAGAGAFLLCPDREVEIAAALGDGTNNRGELWAIAMVMEWSRTYPSGADLYLLTDSQYACDLVNTRSRPHKDVDFVHAVRSCVQHARQHRKIYIAKVAGHCGLEGNDTADLLADLGAQRSANGSGMADMDDFITGGVFCIANKHTAITTTLKQQH
jgi:ribonuclease HI